MKNIKELRELTGQTQKAFATRFGIPLGTLRRWEYGESTPAPYVLKMIADQLPEKNEKLTKIDFEKKVYYYDPITRTLFDCLGTKIVINESIEGAKKENLGLYVSELFDSYYVAVKKLEQDIRFDKTNNIIWEKP